MGHYLELQVTRSGSPEPLRADYDSGSHCGLTFTQQPRIGEFMLFDATSLTVVEDYGETYYGGPRRDLIRDRASALARFRRRLPQVRAALAWDREACVTLVY